MILGLIFIGFGIALLLNGQDLCAFRRLRIHWLNPYRFPLWQKSWSPKKSGAYFKYGGILFLALGAIPLCSALYGYVFAKKIAISEAFTVQAPPRWEILEPPPSGFAAQLNCSATISIIIKEDKKVSYFTNFDLQNYAELYRQDNMRLLSAAEVSDFKPFPLLKLPSIQLQINGKLNGVANTCHVIVLDTEKSFFAFRLLSPAEEYPSVVDDFFQICASINKL